MVFILYKLYVLLPYTHPTPKLLFLLSPPKTHFLLFISILNYGDTENVLINHLLLEIPCHYTNLLRFIVLNIIMTVNCPAAVCHPLSSNLLTFPLID